MTKFNFEKNLSHQTQAVNSTVGVFNSVEITKPQGIEKEFTNPVFETRANRKYSQNIGEFQEENSIERSVKGQSNIIDIIMETGIEGNYTYTKTIFELNKICRKNMNGLQNWKLYLFSNIKNSPFYEDCFFILIIF